MDQDDATVGRILTRREALRSAAAAGVVLTLGGIAARVGRAAMTPAAATQPVVHLVASPALTEGPFFVDERMNRSDLVTGSNRATVSSGLPLLLSLTVYRLAGATYAPLPGAHVDLWNADAAGIYSDEDAPMNNENTAGQRWLRGYQRTDSAGTAQFRTIFPGWYNGRAPHVHFKIRQFDPADQKATKAFTSQLFLSDADCQRIYAQLPYRTFTTGGTTNADDDIYNQMLPDGSVAGKLMTLSLKPNPTGRGHAASFGIALTDETFNQRSLDDGRDRNGPGGPGGAPQGGPPPGGRPPGGPPPGGPPDFDLWDF